MESLIDLAQRLWSTIGVQILLVFAVLLVGISLVCVESCGSLHSVMRFGKSYGRFFGVCDWRAEECLRTKRCAGVRSQGVAER